MVIDVEYFLLTILCYVIHIAVIVILNIALEKTYSLNIISLNKKLLDYCYNNLATFQQPSNLIFLQSLPKREIICGYGEILKHSLISDRKFFLWLSKNAKKIIIDTAKKYGKVVISR